MATNLQILANRENAVHSTGPRTAEGKSRSAANASRHSLTGAFTVLSSESQADYDAMLAGYAAEVQPQSQHEHFLVAQLAQSRWRILRVARLENRLLEQALETGAECSDPDAAILDHMRASGANLLNLLQRYRAAAERSYFKANTELRASCGRTQASRQAARQAALVREVADVERQVQKFRQQSVALPNEPKSSLNPALATKSHRRLACDEILESMGIDPLTLKPMK